MAGTSLSLHPLFASVPSPVRIHPYAPTPSLFPPNRKNPNRTPFRLRNSLRSSSSSGQGSINKPEAEPPVRKPLRSSFLRSASRLLRRIRGDEISLEILYIALPAVLALAADPLASIVDTAFVGHLGSVELAAVGVSVSVFNLVSKLFNIPLLNVTTSFVAEQQALSSSEKEKFAPGLGSVPRESSNGRKYLPAVSTSLALAAGIGIAETIALTLGSGLLMNIMGFAYAHPG